eukprot:6181346-Pleurochrysis_carterae.AAC.3
MCMLFACISLFHPPTRIGPSAHPFNVLKRRDCASVGFYSDDADPCGCAPARRLFLILQPRNGTRYEQLIFKHDGTFSLFEKEINVRTLLVYGLWI